MMTSYKGKKMIEFHSTEEDFLQLYRAGLWNQVPATPLSPHVDWEEVLAIAGKQTTVGLLADGVGVLRQEMPMAVKMKLIGMSVATQKANDRLNILLPKLFAFLGKENIPALLLKGQGVALNYMNPATRQSGDIDLLITQTDAFDKAYRLFKERFRMLEELNPHTLEAVFSVDGVMVELHGRVLSCINRTLEKRFQPWLANRLETHPAREVEIGGGKVLLPPVHADIVFVFVHLARHYFAGGIGLRQVSDWMRLVFKNREVVDDKQLEVDLAHLGLTHVWQVFAAMAVAKLGYPVDQMPLYHQKYEKEGLRVLRYIFDSGNFGYHDERTKSQSDNYYIRRLKAFTGHSYKIFRNFMMFPHETLYCFPDFVKDGLARTKV